LIARWQLEPRFQSKVDLSGVVQQTLFEAHREMEKLSGQSEAQRMAWIRRVLANNLTDAIRRVQMPGQTALREQSLEAALDSSSSHLERWLAAEQTSPSQRAVKREQLLQLAAALAQLPEGQRQAVELHHLRGYRVAEVARLMGRTEEAVGALLVRGLKKLREIMRCEGQLQ
jgi:RNA polymerase sigma-70 factor (ECF subfamily)